MKRNYFVYACSFFFSLGANILGLSMVYSLTDRFSFNPGQIGSFVALGQLFYFLGCNLYQHFGYVLNPAKVFPVAAAIVFIASIPLGFARSRFLVYAAYWVIQISTGLYWPPAMSWITEGLGGKALNHEIGIFNRSWMAASIIGPLIAGSLYQWNSRVNFLIISLCYLLGVSLLRLMKVYSKRKQAYRHEAESEHLQEPEQAVIASATPAVAAGAAVPQGEKTGTAHVSQLLGGKLNLYRYRGWINAFSSAMCLGVIANIAPLHIRDVLGYSERTMGTILFSRSVIGFIGFSVLAKFTFWHFNRRWFFIVQGCLMFCTLLFLPAGNRLPFYFIIVMLFGFLNSSSYDNSIFYSGTTGKNPKKNMAIHEIVLAIGHAAGSAGGGLVYQHFRFTGTCLALFMVLGLNMGVLWLMDKREAR